MAATTIQAAVRSMLLRCWLRTWIRQRSYFTIVCQSYLRRKIACRRWEERKEIEYCSARCIQSHIRMYLAKCKLDFMKRSYSASLIASYFQGYKARKICKIMRKTIHIIKIQTCFRVHLCQKEYEKVKNRKIGAANDIQRCWRGYVSRKQVSAFLRERFNRSCQVQVQIFGADIDYHKRMVAHHSMDNYHVESMKKIHAYECSIWESERKLEELQLMLAQLTPQSVRQGWKEQLEMNVKLERATLTKKKIKAIFEVQKEFVTEKKLVEGNLKTQRELETRLESLHNWKNTIEMSMQRERKAKERLETEVRKRQAIADEKRKWTVQHTVASGKPFKARQSPTKDSNEETREKHFTDILKMQTYLTQLSQLKRTMKW